MAPGTTDRHDEWIADREYSRSVLDDLEPLARHLLTLAPREYRRTLEVVYRAAQAPMPWDGGDE